MAPEGSLTPEWGESYTHFAAFGASGGLVGPTRLAAYVPEAFVNQKRCSRGLLAARHFDHRGTIGHEIHALREPIHNGSHGLAVDGQNLIAGLETCARTKGILAPASDGATALMRTNPR